MCIIRNAPINWSHATLARTSNCFVPFWIWTYLRETYHHPYRQADHRFQLGLRIWTNFLKQRYIIFGYSIHHESVHLNFFPQPFFFTFRRIISISLCLRNSTSSSYHHRWIFFLIIIQELTILSSFCMIKLILFFSSALHHTSAFGNDTPLWFIKVFPIDFFPFKFFCTGLVVDRKVLLFFCCAIKLIKNPPIQIFDNVFGMFWFYKTHPPRMFQQFVRIVKLLLLTPCVLKSVVLVTTHNQ